LTYKGRSKRDGENNGRHVLSEEQVKEIKEKFGRVTHRKLAYLYGVSKSTITQISRGVNWKNI